MLNYQRVHSCLPTEVQSTGPAPDCQCDKHESDAELPRKHTKACWRNNMTYYMFPCTKPWAGLARNLRYVGFKLCKRSQQTRLLNFKRKLLERPPYTIHLRLFSITSSTSSFWAKICLKYVQLCLNPEASPFHVHYGPHHSHDPPYHGQKDAPYRHSQHLVEVFIFINHLKWMFREWNMVQAGDSTISRWLSHPKNNL